jgi:hypothetical protein
VHSPRKPTVTLHQGNQGKLVLSLYPGLLAARVEGHGHEDFARPLSAGLSDMVAAAPQVAVFFDLTSLESYDTGLRTILTSVLRANRRQIESIHTFTRSLVVGAGVAMANLVLGNIKNHREREEFYQALSAKLAQIGLGGIFPSALFRVEAPQSPTTPA